MRACLKICIVYFIGALSSSQLHAQLWQNDGSYTPSLESIVSPAGFLTSMAAAPGARVFVTSGYSINGTQTFSSLRRLNALGVIEQDFQPPKDTRLDVVAVYADGRLLVSAHLYSGYLLSRLLSNGASDPSFNAISVADNFMARILSDGRIVLYGYFTQVGPTRCNGLAVLNANGSIDTSFQTTTLQPATVVIVNDVMPLADGRLLVLGSFSNFGTTERNRIVRLNADGRIDSSFGSTPDGFFGPLIDGGGGKILAGFSSGESSQLVRLTSLGIVDSSFAPQSVGSLSRYGRSLYDGKIFYSTLVNGASELRRLNSDGTADLTFAPLATSALPEVADDGSLYFSDPLTSARKLSGYRVSRASSSGVIDANFSPRIGGSGLIEAMCVQPDGKILAAGQFDYVNNVAKTGPRSVVRLNPDGSTDAAFAAVLGSGESISRFAPVAGGKVVAFGSFSDGSQTVRFNADGTRDSSLRFPPVTNASIAVDPSGSFYIQPLDGSSPVARYSADGVLDTTFQSGLTGPLQFVPLYDGTLLTIRPSGPSATLVRLNHDGSVDSGYSVNQSISGVAYLALPDGRVAVIETVRGTYNTPAWKIRRLGRDGRVDYTYISPETYISTGHSQITDLYIAGSLLDLLRDAGVSAAALNTPWGFSVSADGRTVFGHSAQKRTAQAGPSTDPTPTIVQWNVSSPISISAHGTAGFSALAGGLYPLTYQWLKDGVPVSRATASSYLITDAQVGDSGIYTLRVSNSYGSTTSSGITLTVTAPIAAPSITTQPVSQTAMVGGSVTFAVVAGGNPAPSFQWTFAGQPIAGATQPQLKLSSVQAADAGNYSVIVTNSAGSVTSAAANLSVTATATIPAITVQPANQSVIAGASVTFSVAATGTAPLAYQWRKDGNPISGATNSAYTILSSQVADVGGYSVVVTNSIGSVTSSSANLAVAPVIASPVITTQPAPQFLTTGQSATFTVNAAGTAPLAYQWLRNGTPISAATAATYTIPAAQVTDAASYSVTVTNSAGSVTSTAAALTVTPPSYAGTYFGRFSSNSADRFALVIRPDGTALFLGYAATLFTGYTATTIKINPDGTFTADLTELKPTAANTPAGDALPGASITPPTAAAPLTLSGSVATGALTGGIAGTALTVAAAKSPTTGAAQASAGVYQTNALNSSTGGLTTIVDATGQAFVFSQTTTGVTAGTGTLNPATGQVTTTLADNSLATATLNPTSGSATATLTTTTKETLTFSGLAEGIVRTDRLVNIASRGAVSASDLIIAGFVITGNSPKPVMIRATGPALAAFGLNGTLANPKLELYRGSEKILENDDWSLATNTAAIIATAARTGAFPLAAGTADAVLLTTLEPGGYTAQVSSVTGAPGVSLVEVYDAGDVPATPTTPRLVNISTRATVAGGESLLIAGIVITGNSPKKILIRATGPALTAFGVPGALADPLLKLYKGDTVIRQNDNWSADATEAALIAAAGTATGAFPLTSGTKDAAILITLEPGAYTAQVSGVAGSTGAALVEVYEVP